MKVPTLDPLAPAQSKHCFTLTEIDPKDIKNLPCKQHLGKSTFFSVLVMFSEAFCPRYGLLWPSRSAGLAKNGIPPCLGATGASRLSRFLASGAQGHPENDNLACLSSKAMPSKRRPFKFDGKLGSAT